MNCLQCGAILAGESLPGEVCRCQSEPPPDVSLTAHTPTSVPEPDAWRSELSQRLGRFRARRKMRPPRYPSLALKFEPQEASTYADTAKDAYPNPLPLDSFEPISEQALALSEMNPVPREIRKPELSKPELRNVENEDRRRSQSESTPRPASPSAGAKIIEFPRPSREPATWESLTWGPPPSPPDQLAEPVSDRPRILEAPETVPPAPALGGITIEPVARREPEKRPGIDFPLQRASLPRRLLAALIDGFIITLASVMFSFIFWKITSIRPPLPQILALAASIPCVFWVAYQYLLIVYASSTPGLRLAGLELVRFDGTATSRAQRRWRILASYLSAASLGMGYAWVLLDEDTLCWHDRTTHTCLAPRKRSASPVASA